MYAGMWDGKYKSGAAAGKRSEPPACICTNLNVRCVHVHTYSVCMQVLKLYILVHTKFETIIFEIVRLQLSMRNRVDKSSSNFFCQFSTTYGVIIW